MDVSVPSLKKYAAFTIVSNCDIFKLDESSLSVTTQLKNNETTQYVGDNIFHYLLQQSNKCTLCFNYHITTTEMLFIIKLTKHNTTLRSVYICNVCIEYIKTLVPSNAIKLSTRQSKNQHNVYYKILKIYPQHLHEISGDLDRCVNLLVNSEVYKKHQAIKQALAVIA